MTLRPALFATAFAATTGIGCFAQMSPLDEAKQRERQGRFKEAAQLLQSTAKSGAQSASDRSQLLFELDRLGRIRRDFPYTRQELFAALGKSLKDLTAEEFDRWIAEGRFAAREIDGERRFMGSSVSNLFFRHPSLAPRRIPPKDTAQLDRAVWETCTAIQQAAIAANSPYVLPRRFRATMTVTAKPDAAPAGEIIRGWLPIPRRYPFQTGFKLLKTSSTPRHLEDEQSPIRCIYLEQPARKGEATKFQIEYEYTAHGVWFEVKPETAKTIDPSDPALKPFLGESPHVAFTPEMRALSERITAGETNAARKAKRFYDWIADNILYSYSLEYSTVRNLAEECRENGYGDCGQTALLFITLCRLNGIPARWQSGWNTFPGAKSIHDWCEIYLEPSGWIPVDNYRGVWAMQYALTLSPEQKRAVRDFYFGGLDFHRMAANSDHNQQLTPPKNTFRSDDVDFQRGELESGGQNLYFDRYSYQLEIEEIRNPAE